MAQHKGMVCHTNPIQHSIQKHSSPTHTPRNQPYSTTCTTSQRWARLHGLLHSHTTQIYSSRLGEVTWWTLPIASILCSDPRCAGQCVSSSIRGQATSPRCKIAYPLACVRSRMPCFWSCFATTAPALVFERCSRLVAHIVDLCCAVDPFVTRLLRSVSLA